MLIRTNRDVRRRCRSLLAAVAVAALSIGDLHAQPAADLLLVGGFVYDGSGQPPGRQDVGVAGERISFVGGAAAAGLDAAVVVDVDGLMVTPGFIDMHSHAELTEDYGQDALPFLHQGITTVAIGVDGGGTPDVDELFSGLEGRIGANAFAYVGHGEIRERVIGADDRAPTEAELNEMRALVRQAMNEGAFGLSTGLFYVPGYYAATGEIIELARVAGAFDGIYDTHDRDLGASYRGVGYLESIREAIRIGEAAGMRVIFSHFNAQGASNYGGAPERAPPDRRGARGVWRWRRRSTSTRRPSRAWLPMRYRGGPRTAAARRCSNGSATPRPSAGSTSRRWRCWRSAGAPTSSCSPTRGRS
jgi:N-acyl-D-aspartate/D-glutamate deacylase